MELSYFEFTKTQPTFIAQGVSGFSSNTTAKNYSISRTLFSTQFTCSTSRKYPCCVNCASSAGGNPRVLLQQSLQGADAYGRSFSAGFGTAALRKMSQAEEFPGQESFSHIPGWVFCTPLSPGAMNFSLLVQTQQNMSPNFTQFTILTPPGKTAGVCPWEGGRENPKCQHFSGINPLYFFLTLIHRKVITKARDPEFTRCSCSLCGTHKSTSWTRVQHCHIQAFPIFPSAIPLVGPFGHHSTES